MKKINVIVGICSHYHAGERREAIRNTWLKHPFSRQEIDYRFFIGGDNIPEDNRDDIVALGSPDSYDYLPRKCYDFYKWCSEHYDFDFIFKCDDDTFLAIERLMTLPDYDYGLIGDPSTKVSGRLAPSGGAGYFLSKNLVKDLLTIEIPETGCEDLVFGKLALSLGYECKADERLCLHAGKPPLPDNDMVSCHWCSAEDMYILDQLCREEPILSFQAKHDYWSDELLLYRGSILRRKSGGDIAYLEHSDKGGFSINWLKWQPEVVEESGPGVYQGKRLLLQCKEHKALKRLFLDKDSIFKDK